MKVDHESFENIEKAIIRSHARSKAYGIDTNIAKAPEEPRLTKKELTQRIEKQKIFFDIALEHVNALYALLQDSGFCIGLTDNEGYLLHVVGDADLYKHFQKRNCMPGYRWTEKDLGTCAIGLTLVEKMPIFLPGNKMYAALAQSISNAAAPIFDINQELLGVICLSGYSERMHLHTLGLACQAAETVTSQLKERRNTRELAIKNQYMRALLEADTKGIVTVDLLGNIVQTNRKACNLLDLPEDYQGKSLADYVKTEFNLNAELKAGKGFLVREISTKRGKSFVSLAPITLDSEEYEKHTSHTQEHSSFFKKNNKTKPLNNTIRQKEMVGAIIGITEKKEMVELAIGIAGAEAHFTFDSIVGKSKAIHNAIDMAKIASKNDAPVLLLGDTGTGKELFAQAIHNASDRHDKPFIALNCGAIPKELLESELFGYDEGAFTGAQKGGRAGKFEIADTGTIFLDEIGDMPFDMQVKLLRVLQTGEISRVGSVRTTKINLRVISATNKDLRQEAYHERFRPDLFYRISTLYLTVPPLREREHDIELLIDFFMKRHKYNIKTALCPEAKKLLLKYHWPGNVRQLENSVERAIHLAQGETLKIQHFGLIELAETQQEEQNLNTTQKRENINTKDVNNIDASTIRTLENIEKEAIANALTYFDKNLTKCAQSLGISRPTLYRKMQQYSILN